MLRLIIDKLLFFVTSSYYIFLLFAIDFLSSHSRRLDKIRLLKNIETSILFGNFIQSGFIETHHINYFPRRLFLGSTREQSILISREIKWGGATYINYLFKHFFFGNFLFCVKSYIKHLLGMSVK